jgi:hypothetical protein
LITEGVLDGPELLTFHTLYGHLANQLHRRGLPRPNQRGTDTVHHFALARNSAYGRSPESRDEGNGPALAVQPGLPTPIGPAPAIADVAATPAASLSKVSRPAVLITGATAVAGGCGIFYLAAGDKREHLERCTSPNPFASVPPLTLIASLKGNAAINGLVFTPDRKLLTNGSGKGDDSVWGSITRFGL